LGIGPNPQSPIPSNPFILMCNLSIIKNNIS
jgi:hypothetical protein